MKKLSILIVLLLALTFACSWAQVKEYTDKGARVYILISDNWPLLMQTYTQIGETIDAFSVWYDDKTLDTEAKMVDEFGELHDLRVKLQPVIKELKGVFDET